MKRFIVLLTIILCCVFSGTRVRCQSCCTGDKGNLNLQGQVDLSDLSLLIAHLTLFERPILPCLEAADLDNSQSIDLSDLSIFISAISTGYPRFPACIYDAPYGSNFTFSTCGLTSTAAGEDATSACLRWFYDGYSELYLVHEGAVLNCCLDHIGLSYEFYGDTIVVSEEEVFFPQGPCNCSCNYSVSTSLYNIEARRYFIFVGRLGDPVSYRPKVEVNLLAGPQGSSCW